MQISVIVPTHNRADVLRETLARLSQQQGNFSWEVVVVNNNCTDHTDDVARECSAMFGERLKYVKEGKPGAAAARNRGVREATGDFIVFIDNDIYTAPDFLQRHFDRLQQFPGAWIVGRSENLPEQYRTHFGRFRKSIESPLRDQLAEVDMITGQTTSLPRQKFIELGGFDESFHVASGEDRELAVRALKAGVRILYDPDIHVLHDDWAGTTIRDYCKRQRVYTLTEPFFWKKYGNETPRLRMVKENLPPSLKSDGLKLYTRKSIKAMLGSGPGQRFIIGVCRLMEKTMPRPGILSRFYKMAIAGAIYRGFNDGLKFFEVDYKKLAKNLVAN
jgi:glycosyltransferase involved in cell wall biosynthesis